MARYNINSGVHWIVVVLENPIMVEFRSADDVKLTDLIIALITSAQVQFFHLSLSLTL